MKKFAMLIAAMALPLSLCAEERFEKLPGYEDKCVIDHAGNLIWEIKTPAKKGGLHDASYTYTWFDPKNTQVEHHPVKRTGAEKLFCASSSCNTFDYLAAVNRQGWCGYHDWRLPTAVELASIIEQEKNTLIMLPQHFLPNIPQGIPSDKKDKRKFPSSKSSLEKINKVPFYWSSSVDETYPFLTWGVNFQNGKSYRHQQSNDFYIRLVRNMDSWKTIAGYEDRCIINMDTKLMWEIKSAPGTGGLHDAANRYFWYNAEEQSGYRGSKSKKLCHGSACNTADFIRAVNTVGLCGYRDWRLPNEEEINTIVDRSQEFTPYTFKQYFPYAGGSVQRLKTLPANAKQTRTEVEASEQGKRWIADGAYWVENTDGSQELLIVRDHGAYWTSNKQGGIVKAMSFTTGESIDISDSKVPQHVRLVRDNKRFGSINGYEGQCLYDGNSGLTWESLRTPQTYTWSETQNYVQLVNRQALCSYQDWRLPSVDELLSLVDANAAGTPRYPAEEMGEADSKFENTYFWSATTYPYNSKEAWGVNLYKGFEYNLDKNKAYHLRLVRGKMK